MRRGLIYSFLAAAGFHALLLFGFQASGPVLHSVGSAAGPLEVALVGGGAPGEAGPLPSATEPAPEPSVAPAEKPPEPVAPPAPPQPPQPDAVAVAASTPTPTPTPQPELAPAPVKSQPVAHATPSPQMATKAAAHPGKAKASTAAVSARSGGASAGTGAATGVGGGEGGLGGGAQLRGHPRPEYPPQARRERQEGVALVKVRVGADGLPIEVSLAHSSGFPLLDDAAVRGVRRWTFDPAHSAGVPVASQVEVPVRFNLLP